MTTPIDQVFPGADRPEEKAPDVPRPGPSGAATSTGSGSDPGPVEVAAPDGPGGDATSASGSSAVTWLDQVRLDTGRGPGLCLRCCQPFPAEQLCRIDGDRVETTCTWCGQRQSGRYVEGPVVTCEIDGCTEVATRGCWSCFRRECQPHRGADPCACTWCRAALERCGCLTGCPRCALDALAPPDEPGIPVPVRIGA